MPNEDSGGLDVQGLSNRETGYPETEGGPGSLRVRFCAGQIGAGSVGDPVVFLYGAYVENAPILDARKAVDVSSEVMDLMLQKGDERFVHFRHVYPDDDPAVDDETLQ